MALTLDQFMTALSGQESGGSYTAQNGRTGAYGRFQIMPGNWPSWSREAGLGANAPQTPENQEKVARFKLNQYYDTYGNWEDVASVWYSGQPTSAYTTAQLNRKQGNGNEPSIAEYVDSVMSRAGQGGSNSVQRTTDPEGHTRLTNRIGELEDAIMEGLANEPPDEYDDEGNNPHDSWLERMKVLNSMLSTAYTALGRDDKSFENDATSTGLGLRLDEIEQERGAKEIDRFLGGLQESRGRAQAIADAQKEIRMYGTAPGKTSFSYNDLGAGFAAEAQRMGIDPNKPLVNYSGTMLLDPEADLARYDAQFGVGGAIPSMPEIGTTRNNIPNARAYTSSGVGAGLEEPWWPSDLSAVTSEIDTSPSSLLSSSRTAMDLPAALGENLVDRVRALFGASKNKTTSKYTPPPWKPAIPQLENFDRRSPYARP